MPADLLAEYEAPAQVQPKAPDLTAEFDPPPREEQHAVINDAADKAHQWKMAFDPSLTKEQQTASARKVFSGMIDSLHPLDVSKQTLIDNWDAANKPLVELPQIGEVPDVNIPAAGNLQILAGAYNGAAKFVSGLTSPLSIGTLGTFGALTKAASKVGPAAEAAKTALRVLQAGFAVQMAKGAGEAAGAASVTAGKSTQEETSDVVSALAGSAMTVLAAKGAAETPEPAVKGKAVNPNAVEDAMGRKTDENIAAANADLAAPVRDVPGTAPVNIGPRDATVSDGSGTPTPKEVEMLAEQKRLMEEHLAKPSPEFAASKKDGRFEIVGSRLRGDNRPGSDTDVVTTLTPEEAKALASNGPDEYPVLPQDIKDRVMAKTGDVFIQDGSKLYKVEEHPVTDGEFIVERVSEKEQNILAGGKKGENRKFVSREQTLADAEASKPDLTKEFTPPAPGTEEHAAITEELAQQPAEVAQPEPAVAELPTVPPEDGVTGIRNAIVDQERQDRGLPPAMEAAKKEFGESWTAAAKKIEENPNAGIDLVTELRDKPRPLTDEENALLLHRQIDLQNQFDKVNERIVNGAENHSPEQRAADQVQQARLLDDLLDLYNVGKRVGTEQGRGLAARKMLANEDFSLAKMIVARRAVNEGRPLTPKQADEVQALHEKIAATQKAFDDYVAKTNERLSQMEKTRPGTRNADKNVVSQFIADQAAAARARIKARRAQGILYAGLDPIEVADHAIIGAELIDRGIRGATEWGVEMVKEFGDAIKPHLQTIYQKAMDARPGLEDAAKREATRLKSFKTRAEGRAEDYQERLASGDLGPKEKAPPLKLDEEAQRLKAAADRAKGEFQAALIEDRLANRTSFEKVQDTFVKWRRGFLLSGPATLGKLTGAAMLRMVQTPLEEVIGYGIGKIIPSVADRAPRHGGLNVQAEAAALSGAFFRGMADAAQTIKTGHSDLDVLYGKGRDGNVREQDIAPRSVIEFFGSLHGALKSPVKRAEFERSFEKRIAYGIRNGIDVTDPMVQAKIALDAYKDGNRAIFMQDNIVTDAWNAGIARLTKADKNGKVSTAGKVVSTTMKTLMPIVKVPTNVVAETIELATGSVTGSVKVAKAVRAGTEKLPPEQADIIMRQLKKGSLGLALLVLGYFRPDIAGGLYQQGEKRKPGDVKVGGIRIFGHDIPAVLVHNPAVEAVQIGSTIRRIVNSKLRGPDAAATPANNYPILDATGLATLGLAEEIPFFRTPLELSKVMDKNQRTKALGDVTRSLVVPELVQSAARFLDKDAKGEPQRRNPKTVLENVKTGIPILREDVRRK